jgi:hypothetical protein
MTRIVCAAFVAVLLVACGRKPAPASEPEAAPASATDDTGAPATAEGALAAPAPLVFRVMREGGGGIDAVINRIDSQNNAIFYATVPGDGTKAMDKPCDPGDRFRAEPKVDSFQLEAPKDCSPLVEFMLLSTRTTFEIMRRGDVASEAGNFTLAQSNYGIAADRLAYAKPAESRRLRVLSTVAAGRVLGVTRPVKGADGKEQPTVEFKDRVRVFQRENGIEETGELDARTRESIGRMQLRGADVVVPPAAAVTHRPDATAVSPQEPAPAIALHLNPTQMLAVPASPETAAIIHANRKKMLQAAKP